LEDIKLPLKTQIHVYSIDTSAFYKKRERKIHNKLNQLYYCKKIYRKKLNKEKDEKVLKRYRQHFDLISKNIKILKKKLTKLLSKNDIVRRLDQNSLNKRNVVSVFESNLTRSMQIPMNTLSTDIFIVKAYFFEVIEDIILDGFTYNGEKYVCFTASAGQIRTKKTMFIKESVLKEIENTLMCGLTKEVINNYGGVNINKYLAYLALCNSATDPWVDFDITKSIVVDDMETEVTGMVDFIDDKTYEITRKEMSIPITHTDGCGMILPSISKKSFMVRMPWIKGLLTPFPFDKFINEISYNGKVNDIYNKEWDIIKDDIQIIFTKSQFKMWKYYKTWKEYCDNFKKYNCQANKCNEEEDVFENAKINYQMLQSLVDITEDELLYLAGKTIKHINKIGKDRRTMLKVFGVTKGNTNKTYLQQAIELYPELLCDTYTKEVLRDIKKSLVTEGRSAKFEIFGTYTFICPDLYAFCEYIFLGNKNPKGLLNRNEVYCKLFKDVDKLDCLRSPHLYREHAIRRNVVTDEKSDWFTTNGLYTSIDDLISKILQFDNDGDKSLVCADTTFVAIAERNMKNIVPLYYQMKKAGAELISNQSIFNSLKLAYTGGNIGSISNVITKIWNRDDIKDNTEALKAIKLLCMENNFTIDYAKTLYKPTRPLKVKQFLSQFTKSKTPHFFIYAKDKKHDQVESKNKSTVNKLNKIIPNKRIKFEIFGEFDYKKLLSSDREVILDNDIINIYKKLDQSQHILISLDEDDEEYNNLTYIYQDIRNQILKVNNDANYVVDVLVEYLYHKRNSRYKDTLWLSFGDVLVQNLMCNVKEKYIYCEGCGNLVIQKNNRHKYCGHCWHEINKEQIRKRVEKHRNVTV
jgi:hypothetical protein